ncbi:MAG: extracellular solute-binding protein [Burkholderiales bacterium]|nr:extracellular solute-binding protein [Burkholderiales bacterium]
MPDGWANWKQTWADLARLYGLAHVDTDMSSAEEIAKMIAEGSHGTVDIGDVGFEFGALARARGVTAAYKPATWAQVPDWAKDPDGHWALGYTGTIALVVNTRRLGPAPRSWHELFASRARVDIGEVGRAAQANAGVLAAAVALGGDEQRLDPALAAFGALARAGRLLSVNPSPVLMERGEADVFVMWDFNALAYRDTLPNKADYAVLIPVDGSVTSGYTSILNVHAPHPNAARLAREYIFSDAGQLNLARGYARPVRVDHLTLPADVRARLLEAAQYRAARPVRVAAWTEAARSLGARWQDRVLAGAR